MILTIDQLEIIDVLTNEVNYREVTPKDKITYNEGLKKYKQKTQNFENLYQPIAVGQRTNMNYHNIEIFVCVQNQIMHQQEKNKIAEVIVAKVFGMPTVLDIRFLNI